MPAEVATRKPIGTSGKPSRILVEFEDGTTSRVRVFNSPTENAYRILPPSQDITRLLDDVFGERKISTTVNCMRKKRKGRN